MVARSSQPPETLRAARGDPRVDLDARARLYLQMLGRADHPDAHDDPIGALYQVAVDLRCTADGYRALYLEHQNRPR